VFEEPEKVIKDIKTMDFEGQKLAELLFYYIILCFGAVGWVYGYLQQDFTYVFQAWLVGLVISVIVSLLIAVFILLLS
jgi:hypothetical protein